MITASSIEVYTDGIKTCINGDLLACPIHGPNPVSSAHTALSNQQPFIAIGCVAACGAVITSGSPTTFVDDPENLSSPR